MKCVEVRESLPTYARERGASLAWRRHISGCAGCRAELARYELMIGRLGDLRTATVAVPPGLVDSLNAIPANENRVFGAVTHVFRHRRAYLGGVAVAAAGATGAVLLRSRARRVATA